MEIWCSIMSLLRNISSPYQRSFAIFEICGVRREEGITLCPLQ